MTAPAWFHVFKRAIYALLAVNLALYALLGTPNQIVDSAAWIVLLALFEIETAHGERLTRRQLLFIHIPRLAAAAGVLAAAIGYVRDAEWLDAANTCLWMGVVIMLEAEVRFPAAVARRQRPFWFLTGSFYAALGVLVLVWAGRGQWLDAWDAALWLTAFFAVELNVLERQNGYPST